MRHVLIISVLTLCVASPGRLSAQKTTRERDASWVAPADADRRSHPLVTRPGAAAGGATLYSQRCAACHGEQENGSSRAPTLTTTDTQRQTDGALFWKVSNGNAGNSCCTCACWQTVRPAGERRPQ